MTPHDLHLRLDKAQAALRLIREASDKRYRDAGPQQPRDGDYSARWLGKPLNWQQGEEGEMKYVQQEENQ